MFIVTKQYRECMTKRVWWQYNFYRFSQASPTLINQRVPENVIFRTSKPWAQLLAHFLTSADSLSPKKCQSTALQSDFSRTSLTRELDADIPVLGNKMLTSSGVSHPVSAAQFSIQEPSVSFTSADHAYVLRAVEPYDVLEPLSVKIARMWYWDGLWEFQRPWFHSSTGWKNK